MNCTIVTNQQASLPVLDEVTLETKVKDSKRVEAGNVRQSYMKKLKDMLLKDKTMQMA